MSDSSDPKIRRQIARLIEDVPVYGPLAADDSRSTLMGYTQVLLRVDSYDEEGYVILVFEFSGKDIHPEAITVSMLSRQESMAKALHAMEEVTFDQATDTIEKLVPSVLESMKPLDPDDDEPIIETTTTNSSSTPKFH